MFFRKQRQISYDAQIQQWLDQGLPVSRMLEPARADTTHPHSGEETAFYNYVCKLRRARKQPPRNLALCLEEVSGEFLQIDWGEVRQPAFSKTGEVFYLRGSSYRMRGESRQLWQHAEESLLQALQDGLLQADYQ